MGSGHSDRLTGCRQEAEGLEIAKGGEVSLTRPLEFGIRVTDSVAEHQEAGGLGNVFRRVTAVDAGSSTLEVLKAGDDTIRPGHGPSDIKQDMGEGPHARPGDADQMGVSRLPEIRRGQAAAARRFRSGRERVVQGGFLGGKKGTSLLT